MDRESRRIWISEVILAAAGIGLLVWAWPAHAQTPPPGMVCAPFNEVKATLEEKKQVELAGGVVSATEALIIFGTPNGSDWTAIAVQTDGGACIIGSGEGWFQIPLLSGRPV